MIDFIKTHAKKILGIIGVVALFLGLFLDVKDFTSLFRKEVDLSGEWTFTFKTKETSYIPYLNSKLEYRMVIVQDGERADANGETMKYNGEDLPPERHRPLSAEGTLKKDILFCTYTLIGGLRKSTGSFKAKYEGGKLIGTFSGTAANSKGEFYGERIE